MLFSKKKEMLGGWVLIRVWDEFILQIKVAVVADSLMN